MAGGIEGFLRQLTYFGGAAIVTGALLYGPSRVWAMDPTLQVL